jgi:hypothetical protein
VKRFLIPAVLSVALVLPAQAVAKKPKHYTGTVTPSGTIGFKVTQKKHSKQKSVSGFNFAGVPVTCEDGAHTARGFVSFPVKLNKGKFNIVASSNVTGAKLDVHGNLAAGTIQLSGNTAIEPSATGSNCESGVLSWTAHRG